MPSKRTVQIKNSTDSWDNLTDEVQAIFKRAAANGIQEKEPGASVCSVEVVDSIYINKTHGWTLTLSVNLI